MNFPMPPGLDTSEQLAYRLGYSRAYGAYLKANGTPSIAGKDKVALLEHARAWHADHDAARMAKGHSGGVSGVRAYWKRHGIADREHLIGKSPAVRKPRQVCCEHCGQMTAVA